VGAFLPVLCLDELLDFEAGQFAGSVSEQQLAMPVRAHDGAVDAHEQRGAWNLL